MNTVVSAVFRWLPIAALAGLAACTWVKPTAGAAGVAIATDAEVAACERVGIITANTRSRVGFERNRNKVRVELETLARNDAASLGANTIVPVGIPEEGVQTFNAYTCPRPG